VIVQCLRSDTSCAGHYNRSCLLTYLQYVLQVCIIWALFNRRGSIEHVWTLLLLLVQAQSWKGWLLTTRMPKWHLVDRWSTGLYRAAATSLSSTLRPVSLPLDQSLRWATADRTSTISRYQIWYHWYHRVSSVWFIVISANNTYNVRPHSTLNQWQPSRIVYCYSIITGILFSATFLMYGSIFYIFQLHTNFKSFIFGQLRCTCYKFELLASSRYCGSVLKVCGGKYYISLVGI